jgi:hypothetical protein
MNEEKKLRLKNEIETSTRLIKEGMAELQGMKGKNSFHYPSILHLSRGYEGLIKSLLFMMTMDEKGTIKEVPYESEGRKDHDLDHLFSSLLALLGKKEHSSRFPDEKKDIDFLKNDKKLRKVVTLLSHFVQSMRYYNTDILFYGKTDHDNPELIWKKLEAGITPSREDISKKVKKARNITYRYKKMSKEFIITLEEFTRNLAIMIVLEKFTRALTIVLTSKTFGETAREIAPSVRIYRFLKDTEFGTRDYREII